jgi:hypothetical protein
MYDHIRDVMLLQGGLAIERMCFVAGVSRAGFYRHLRAQDPWQEEMAVRSEVQRIALEHRLSADNSRVAASGNAGESQTSGATDA